KIRAFKKSEKTAIVNIGLKSPAAFQQIMADALSDETTYYVTDETSQDELKKIIKEVKKNKQIILAIHDTRSRPRPQLPVNKEVENLVKKLAKKSIVTFFTNPYAIDGFKGVHKSKT